MTYQAYLDNIKAKTGKSPDDFRKLAAKKGLTKYPEIMTWLKSDFELGHGHANAIAHEIVNADAPQATTDEAIAKLFSGKKEKWRGAYDALAEQLIRFGADVTISATNTYISLLRKGKKFGIVMPSSAERLDIGIKFKGVAPTTRLEASGTWHNMVTHRVRITDPKQIDKELSAWLKQAYEAA
jgi:predicted transport protein